MSIAIDMYLNQISLTGGIPFAVTLPKAPNTINADFMTSEEFNEKLQRGYDDIEAGNVQMLQLHLQSSGRVINMRQYNVHTKTSQMA